jgi:hypothetical protein
MGYKGSPHHQVSIVSSDNFELTELNSLLQKT